MRFVLRFLKRWLNVKTLIHGYLSIRNRMQDFRVGVGNLIKIISKPTFFCFQMKTFTSDALYKITTDTNKEYTCNRNMYVS